MVLFWLTDNLNVARNLLAAALSLYDAAAYAGRIIWQGAYACSAAY
jgi:hypothetical protein